ncbi:MAG: D-sedoheptulose 7-phosphate isomerase [Fibrobacterota bacterium]|nr:D-sedoheptulose 7-phosphate isomerase [Fibrobacterota bacterium]
MQSEKHIEAIVNSLAEGLSVLERFSSDSANRAALATMACIVAKAFGTGKKVLSCGNGGSACDAIHFAEEFTGRYRKDRKALPAIALADGAHLTCVGNDYGFDEVFARGVAAYGQPGDVLLAISTSGNSKNVIRAVEEARKHEMSVLLFLGREGGSLRGRGDAEIVVAGENTDRIQEIHMIGLHILIECVERELFPENYV